LKKLAVTMIRPLGRRALALAQQRLAGPQRVPVVQQAIRHFSGPQRPTQTINIDAHPNVSGEEWANIVESLNIRIQNEGAVFKTEFDKYKTEQGLAPELSLDDLWKKMDEIPAEEWPANFKRLRESHLQVDRMMQVMAIAEAYHKASPERKFKRNLTQDEAGAVDQIASVLGNAAFKHGQELHKRVVQGYDTKREYWSDCALYGPFGTEDAPVYVPANDNHRFVGCLGGYDGVEEHELVWFLVRQCPKHRCPMCGQIFQLVTSDTSHRDHPLHDPTKDYKRERWERMSNNH